MTDKATHDETEIHANCIFCKITRGEVPAVKVYEDDDVLAFLDIKPSQRGHVLVIGKAHHENIYSLPAETVCRIALITQKVAIAVKNALSADGINIVMNNESAAGQIIDHNHTHIIPRFNEDGGYLGKKYTYVAGEMEELAEKIKLEIA